MPDTRVGVSLSDPWWSGVLISIVSMHAAQSSSSPSGAGTSLLGTVLNLAIVMPDLMLGGVVYSVYCWESCQARSMCGPLDMVVSVRIAMLGSQLNRSLHMSFDLLVRTLLSLFVFTESTESMLVSWQRAGLAREIPVRTRIDIELGAHIVLVSWNASTVRQIRARVFTKLETENLGK